VPFTRKQPENRHGKRLFCRDTAGMSKGNVEITCQSMEAFDRRDRTAWLALHDQDYEVIAIDDWPEAGVRGAEAAWDFYATVFDAIGRVRSPSGAHNVDFVDAGADKVLVHHRIDLSGGESGASIERNYWDVATIRQGRILREHWFVDHAEALEAAGLSE
jgi:ketosteroid isomerase-like protein